MTENQIRQALAEVGIFESELVQLILDEGKVQTLPKGTPVMEEGRFIRDISIVLEGEVRVWKNAPDAKEILLYYVQPVQTCVMSIAACFRDKKSVIDAESIKPTTVLTFPAWGLDKWMRFEQWRQFVINSFIHSYDDIIELYGQLAFHKLDERILNYLDQYAEKNNDCSVNLSHSGLANEMGTSREVVSRVLKNMEQEGLIELDFKKIRRL